MTRGVHSVGAAVLAGAATLGRVLGVALLVYVTLALSGYLGPVIAAAYQACVHDHWRPGP